MVDTEPFGHFLHKRSCEVSPSVARGIPNLMKKWINTYKTDSVSIF